MGLPAAKRWARICLAVFALLLTEGGKCEANNGDATWKPELHAFRRRRLSNAEIDSLHKFTSVLADWKLPFLRRTIHNLVNEFPAAINPKAVMNNGTVDVDVNKCFIFEKFKYHRHELDFFWGVVVPETLRSRLVTPLNFMTTEWITRRPNNHSRQGMQRGFYTSRPIIIQKSVVDFGTLYDTIAACANLNHARGRLFGSYISLMTIGDKDTLLVNFSIPRKLDSRNAFTTASNVESVILRAVMRSAFPDTSTFSETSEPGVEMLERMTYGSVVAICEFSYCKTPTAARTGIRMPLNFRKFAERLETSNRLPNPLKFPVFLGPDPSCIAASFVANLTYINTFALSGFAGHSDPNLYPFAADPDGSARTIVAYELLKRGISVINTDPDVIPFRPFPHRDMDSDVSMAWYSGNAVRSSPGYLVPDEVQTGSVSSSLSNFGQWFWSATDTGLILFQHYFFALMTDLNGQDEETALKDDLPESPLRRNDDQYIWGKFAKYIDEHANESVAEIRAGNFTRHVSSSGPCTFRSLHGNEFPMAESYLEGFRNTSLQETSLHMATFGEFKFEGLVERKLVDEDVLNLDAQGGHRENSFYDVYVLSVNHGRFHKVYTSLQQERDAVVLLLLLSLLSGRTPVLPTFNCAYCPLPVKLPICLWYHQYDYSPFSAGKLLQFRPHWFPDSERIKSLSRCDTPSLTANQPHLVIVTSHSESNSSKNKNAPAICRVLLIENAGSLMSLIPGLHPYSGGSGWIAPVFHLALKLVTLSGMDLQRTLPDYRVHEITGRTSNPTPNPRDEACRSINIEIDPTVDQLNYAVVQTSGQLSTGSFQHTCYDGSRNDSITLDLDGKLSSLTVTEIPATLLLNQSKQYQTSAAAASTHYVVCDKSVHVDELDTLSFLIDAVNSVNSYIVPKNRMHGCC